jgi:ATP-binding cassette subfamily C (CFTR/MRP) protein 4
MYASWHNFRLIPCKYLSKVLTAEKAFLCLSMFNTVRLSMTLFFPFAISQLGEIRVSISRIQVIS